MSKQELHSKHFLDDAGNPSGGTTFGAGLCIAWQHGPLGRDQDRQVPNGCFVETVIAAAVDRLRHYQDTKFASRYNQEAIEHLRMALAVLNRRTAEREALAIEGTHVP